MSRVNLDYGAIVRLASDTSEELAHNAAENVQARARRYAPRKTGFLAESITIARVERGMKVTYVIFPTADYARYQEFGTGPIVPVQAKALRFEAGGEIVFAKRTRGVPATHFMQRAAAVINIADFVA